jgi:hypothetical protein
VPRSVGMKLVGHKTEAVYRRYSIVSDTDLREAAGRLAEFYGGEGQAATPTPQVVRAGRRDGR